MVTIAITMMRMIVGRCWQWNGNGNGGNEANDGTHVNNEHNDNDVDKHADAERDSSLDTKTIHILFIAEINDHRVIVAHPLVVAVTCNLLLLVSPCLNTFYHHEQASRTMNQIALIIGGVVVPVAADY